MHQWVDTGCIITSISGCTQSFSIKCSPEARLKALSLTALHQESSFSDGNSFLSHLSLVICTSVNKLEAKVNRERSPRFSDVYVTSLTAADQYLKTLYSFRSPHQDSLGQEGRAGSVGIDCRAPLAYGGGMIVLPKSCAMALVQRLLRGKNRLFAFDTKSRLPVRRWVGRKESRTIHHRKVTPPPYYGTGEISEIQAFPLLIKVRQAPFTCCCESLLHSF